MTQQDPYDDNKTRPVATPYDHPLDISEFPTYRPASAIAPVQDVNMGRMRRRFTLPFPEEPIDPLEQDAIMSGVGRAPGRITPPLAPDEIDAIVSARERALMHILLPQPPRTEAEVRQMAINPSIQHRLRWHEAMLRRWYWPILSAPKDESLCMRCRLATRSITYALREYHEALIWLCERCQRCLIDDAEILAARFKLSVRQIIDHHLMDELNTYQTPIPATRALR